MAPQEGKTWDPSATDSFKTTLCFKTINYTVALRQKFLLTNFCGQLNKKKCSNGLSALILIQDCLSLGSSFLVSICQKQL